MVKMVKFLFKFKRIASGSWILAAIFGSGLLVGIFQKSVTVKNTLMSRQTDREHDEDSLGLEGADYFEDTPLSIARWMQPNVTTAEILIYNRIPKTAGSTTEELICQLAARSHDSFRCLTNAGETGLFPTNKLWKYLKRSSRHGAIVYIRHMPFVHFPAYSTPVMPLFINTFRDPVDNLVSSYYFSHYLRSLASQDPAGYKPLSFETCYKMNCTGIFYRPNQLIKWFCGYDDICLTPSPTSLSKAKHNVDMYYVSVGPSNDLRRFSMVLESLLPQFFTGAPQLYQELFDEGRLSKFKNSSPYYRQPSQSLRDSLAQTVLHYDYDLYKFLLKRFQEQCSFLNI